MIYIILGAVLALFSLIAFLHRPKKCEHKSKRISGLKPSHPIEGNNPDIKAAKQMFIFVKDLHQRFGPIASFWEGKNLAVSVASPELFKELRHLGNVSTEIFDSFRGVFGNDCMAFKDLDEVFRRRKLYDHHFQLKGCKSYFKCFLEIAHEYVEKWKQMNSEDHIPLMETSLEATLKGILRSSFGEYFKDDESLKHFQTLFTRILTVVDKTEAKKIPEDESFKKDVREIRSIIGNIVKKRREDLNDTDRSLFIDVLLGNDATESQCSADSSLFIASGYDSTGQFIMWVIYEIAMRPEIQEKVYQELTSVLKGEPVSLETIPKLVYLRQVIDETLRFRGVTLCIGRKTDTELKLGDYEIPPNVNVYQAIGYVFHDPTIFPEPEKFDPERFSAKNRKERHPYAFKPFGFAGKRQCPGQTYAYSQVITVVAEWLRHFQIKLVPNQTLNLCVGQVIRPVDEIWVTIEQRK